MLISDDEETEAQRETKMKKKRKSQRIQRNIDEEEHGDGLSRKGVKEIVVKDCTEIRIDKSIPFSLWKKNEKRYRFLVEKNGGEEGVGMKEGEDQGIAEEENSAKQWDRVKVPSTFVKEIPFDHHVANKRDSSSIKKEEQHLEDFARLHRKHELGEKRIKTRDRDRILHALYQERLEKEKERRIAITQKLLRTDSAESLVQSNLDEEDEVDGENEKEKEEKESRHARSTRSGVVSFRNEEYDVEEREEYDTYHFTYRPKKISIEGSQYPATPPKASSIVQKHQLFGIYWKEHTGPVPEKITVTENRIRIKFTKMATRSRTSSGIVSLPNPESPEKISDSTIRGKRGNQKHISYMPRTSDPYLPPPPQIQGTLPSIESSPSLPLPKTSQERVNEINVVSSGIDLVRRRGRPRTYPRIDRDQKTEKTKKELMIPEPLVNPSIILPYQQNRDLKVCQKRSVSSFSNNQSEKKSSSSSSRMMMMRNESLTNPRSTRVSLCNEAFGSMVPGCITKKKWLDDNDVHWKFLNSRGIF